MSLERVTVGSRGVAYSDSADGPLGHTLMTVTSDGVIHPTGLGMMAGTSPSVAQMPDGGYWSAMQANTGELWTVNAQQVGHPENIAMAPGTSPGMGFVTTINNPITFVQTSAGRRGGLVGSGGGDFLANDDPQLMAPGTSVGVSQEAGEAWQDNTGHLADVQISDGAMAPGTSPSFTQAQAAASLFKVVTAFQGADHDLRYVLDLQPPRPPVTTEVDTRLGMQPGTSPAVAVQPDGTFEVAFQANTHILWVVDSQGVGHSTGLSMDPGSSPSITGLPGGGFEIAFQANTHALWSVDQNGAGHVVNGAIMTAGSSPGISAYVPLQGSTTNTVPLTLNEQQVGSGPIPFSGSFPPFGTTRSGTVQSITYPASGFLDSSLLFVKAGHSTAECNNPGAVVALAEGQTTTPAQLAAIFGTTTPSFSTTSPFRAVACFSGPNPTPSFINLPMNVLFN